MRAVIQRVLNASVTVNDKIIGQTSLGLLILLGIEHNDTEEDVIKLAKKIVSLRIFSDDEGKMNLNVDSVNGGLLIISQFTLHASTKKGTRPSFVRAAHPSLAIPLYERFISECRSISNSHVETGEFGADMSVSLVNSGPVTIIIDTKD
ncbi:MAG TPA: D-tyrosyl-tRNA(Tyr) deacylase [Flavobacteriales bacterium]|nr:D-tyrosyl-tRNA(Tyr) deacylase [Flavobacteriales bacterium]